MAGKLAVEKQLKVIQMDGSRELILTIKSFCQKQ